MSTTQPLERIGVGIDTARYGHRVTFLRPDRQPAAKPLTVLENQQGYQDLRQRLEGLHQQHPQAHFHIRIDAAGQYATNLECFLRTLPLPLTISVGEPKRNKDYQKAHFPKRTTDDTESQAMARFAVVEQPHATLPLPPALVMLREVAGRLQAQVKQTTQAVNRLHNLLARVFPELATLTTNVATAWVLHLLDKYPTAPRIAQARLSSLEKIPFAPADKVHKLHEAAPQSVGSLQGELAETLVRELVAQVRQAQAGEHKLRKLLHAAYADLPPAGYVHLVSIPGIGVATAAALVAKIIDIDRFATPEDLVGYFGIFPQESTSGVDPLGQPLPPGTQHMSPKGNDLVRMYLWNAAFSAIQNNPAVRSLYRRLRAKGKRGDVALGHCMRKLLHLVFAVWKTSKPFDPNHYPWEQAVASSEVNRPAAEKNAVGHRREPVPAEQVVTTASPSAESSPRTVNADAAANPAAASPRPQIDFAFLRQQITLEQVLRHLGLFDDLRGRAPQLRGRCPFHEGDRRQRTLSIHLGKNAFHCFHADCQRQGNALDFWAAHHRLPLYEAALHLADTFHLYRNREEAPVNSAFNDPRATGAHPAVITADGP
ncbi:MAG TPA: transposase [Candidatus Binatia bacterium]|nr:transposase [Candidatus Binatia bacterium]